MRVEGIIPGPFGVLGLLEKMLARSLEAAIPLWLLEQSTDAVDVAINPEATVPLWLVEQVRANIISCQQNWQAIAANKHLSPIIEAMDDPEDREWTLEILDPQEIEKRAAILLSTLEVGDWSTVLQHLRFWDEEVGRLRNMVRWWSEESPRRNAKKPRPRESWQRELIKHLSDEDAPKTHLAKFRSLPEEHLDREPLILCNGKFEICRDKDKRIICKHLNGKNESISYARFLDYLKEINPRKAK